ncbi:MAG: DUF2726 domain-containing protein [Ottowia sp.]
MQLATNGKPITATDQFSATPVISAVEMELLNYLQHAFHGRQVLFRVALSHIVSARKTQDRLGVQRRLNTHVVDYVVCDRKGNPAYAFELDALHDSAEDAARDAKEKHRVLKTAQIPLVRLKRSIRTLPPASEFRRLLRTTEAQEAADDALHPEDGPLASPGNRTPGTGLPPGFEHTQPPSVTDLMGLPDAPKAKRGAADDSTWVSTQQV